jgi:hypothetical protein
MNSTTAACRLTLLLGAVACAGGCNSMARTPQHRLTIDAPATVKQDGLYAFRVHITTADGAPADRVSYMWMIDWPEVKGMLHSGLSSQRQEMMVKGGPGKALLRIYADDATGRRVQVDKFEFQVVKP